MVLDLLGREPILNEIAANHQIAPNQLRNWKVEFLNNAELVFDRKRNDRLLEKLQTKQREADALAKKVEQQAVTIDLLKSQLRSEICLSRRVELLREVCSDAHKPFTVSLAADLLSVNRTSAYAKPVGISESEVAAKRLINAFHTDHPTWGSRKMSKQLKAAGLAIGRFKTRRYMSEMGIYAFFPKANL